MKIIFFCFLFHKELLISTIYSLLLTWYWKLRQSEQSRESQYRYTDTSIMDPVLIFLRKEQRV